MSAAEDDLQNFTAFVRGHISKGDDSDLGLAELFDLWMLEKSGDADYEANVAAINASINDFFRGERGTLAGEHSRELRARHGLNDE
jgi:hypothetical protein